MPALQNRFVQLLLNQGEDNAAYRTEKLKHYLQQHFGSRVEFYRPPFVGADCVVHGTDLPLDRVMQILH